MSATTNSSENKVSLLQRALYQAAKKSAKRRFHSLYSQINRNDVLCRAWMQVKANRGQGGIDGQSIEVVEKEIGLAQFLGEIEKELREGSYKPQPVRRVEIPKASGGSRPLGIPTLKDRTVQAACRMVLEPIFEADFLDCSYGFRPKRNAQQAHAEIKKTINAGHHWVVDGDIEKYFDSIPHEKLMKLVELRVSDRRVLRLVRGWLKAGIWKDGQVTGSRLGTPQGGVISPLLSNIYLHYFDRLWHKHHAKLGKLVRYADDFVILCQGEKEADQCLAALGSLLQRFDLKLHPLKTRKVDMSQGKEGFDVLGFHFHRTPSFRNPARRYCLSWPSKAAMKKVSESITAQTSCLYPRSLDEVAESLNRIIRGWTNYFKVGNSNRKFYILDQHVQRRLHRFCCKKFQHVTWAKTALRIRGMNLLSAAKVAPGWRLSHAAGL